MSDPTQSFELKLRVFSKQEFHCPLCKCPLNLEAVFNPASLMAAVHVPAPKRVDSLSEIMEDAERWCVEARVMPKDLRSKARFAEIVKLRARFCRAMRDKHHSLSAIGRWLGVHHTSVLHALRKAPPSSADPNSRRRPSAVRF